MPLSHEQHKSAVIGISLACLAYICYNITDVAAKILGKSFHFSQVAVTNAIIVVLLMSIYGAIKYGHKAFVVHHPKLMLFRAGLATATGGINLFVLPHVELATFYTLIFTSPLWVAVLSAIFLKEKLEPKRIAAIVGGFAVIFFVFRPGGELFSIWTPLILLSALTYAGNMVAMRKMGPNESRVAIVLTGSLVSIMTFLPIATMHFAMPEPNDMLLFLGMGIFGSCGGLAIAYAFQNAPSAAVIAPTHYTQIIWGTLIGYVFFSEVPHIHTIIGACVIAAAGLYLIYGEARYKKRMEAIARAEMEVTNKP